MRVDLDPFLAEHPDGSVHQEHGVSTVDHAGAFPARHRGLPWDYRAPGMRAWCGCGWAGTTHTQTRVPEHGDSGARRSEWDREHRAALRAMDEEWSEHVHTALPTLRVLEVMAELREAERALTSVVIDARAGGASWTDIGTAAGVKRQSAHQRWGAHDPLLPAERSRGGRPRGGDRADAVTAVDESVPAPSGPEPPPRPQRPSDRAHVTARMVRSLAHELTRRTDRHVDPSWQGTRSRDGRSGGWLVEWSGGPTRREMRDLAATVLTETPALADLDLAALSWWRSNSDVNEAAATLAWLEEHPDEGSQLRYVRDDSLPGWPENLPARMRGRAETLVAAGWAPMTAGPAADTLAQHATAGGPTAVHVWLDELAEVQDAPVVDLPSRRR